MFEFFKKRFRNALKRATEAVEEEVEEDIEEGGEKDVEESVEKTEEESKESKESKEGIEGIEGKEDKTPDQEPNKKKDEKQDEKEDEEDSEDKESPEKPKKGFFKRLISGVTKTKITEQKFEDLFWEIELVLLENNVAYGVIEKIKEELAQELIGKEVSRSKLQQEIANSIKSTIEEILIEPFDLVERIKEARQSSISSVDESNSNNKPNNSNQRNQPDQSSQSIQPNHSTQAPQLNQSDQSNQQKQPLQNNQSLPSKKPYVICFLGINGSGKTTTLAKVGYLLKKNGLSSVFAASDTFRAAAIQQLENHAKRLGIKIIKHDYGADSAAVGYDAIEHAKSKNIDVVLIDSAGRLHSNKNLMDELKKLIRVTKPDLKVFVGEMITGNDCIEQAQKFEELVGIDAVILTKSDVDEKGGTAISIGYVLKKPIIMLGNGQGYDDLVKFDKDLILSNLFE